MSPPWYEVLLIGERQLNQDLVKLCDQQQKLIESLERKLGATSGTSEHLSASSTASDDEPVITMGPTSNPIQWTGSPIDCVPVSVNGQRMKVVILTKEMIEHWNNIFDIQPKIDVYDTVIGEAASHMKRCYTSIKIADEREAQNEGEGAAENEDEEDDEIGENIDRQSLLDEYSVLSKGYQQVQPKFDASWKSIKSHRDKLYCEMYRLFKSQRILRHQGDDAWKDELFNSRLWHISKTRLAHLKSDDYNPFDKSANLPL